MKPAKSDPHATKSAGVGPGVAPAAAAADASQKLLTTRELMEFLNVSRTKIWELVKQDGLPAFKIGGDYRYRLSEVVAWLERYRVPPPPQ